MATGLRALLLVAIVLCGVPTLLAQSSIASEDFEGAETGFVVNIGGSAQANYNDKSKDGARNGQAGLRVTVTQAGASADVVVEAPVVTLSGGATYTFEFWARTMPNQGTAMFVIQTGSGQVAAQGTQTIAPNNWGRYQIPFTPMNGGPYQLLIQIGSTATAFHFDDYSVSQQLPNGASDSAGGLSLPPLRTPTTRPAPSNTPTNTPATTPTNTPTPSSGGSSMRAPNGQVVVDGSKPGVLFNQSFEEGPAGFTGWVSDQAAGKPTLDMASPEGAHTGKLGISVNNPTVQSKNFFVQVKTALTTMQTDMVYSMSFWARTDTPGVLAQVDLLQDGTFTWVEGMGVTLTTNWTRYIMDSMQVPKAASYFVGIAMGSSNGTFFFDDFALTAEKGAPVRTVDEVVAMAVPDAKAATLASTKNQAVLADGLNSTGNSSGIDVAALVKQFDDDVAKARKGSLTVTFKDANGKAVGSIDSLKLTLEDHDFAWGTAINHNKSTDAYYKTASSYFNSIVNENIFKWAEYEPTLGDYKPSEKIFNESYVNWAESNEMKMIRGHAVEWLHDGYGFDKHFSRQEGCEKYKAYLKTRITRDLGAFKGRVHQYDVWNELLNQNNWARKCDLIEDGTVAEAFKWARAADPSAKLCFNDFWIMDGLKTQDMIDLVKKVRSQGAQVDCIGIQAHLDVAKGVALGSYASRLKQLAELGLPMVISEFDIRTGDIPDGPTGPYTGTPVMSETPEAQAAVMTLYAASWFAEPSVEGIFLWGFTDAIHWITNGGIFDAAMQPKPAALALQELWTEVYTTSVDEKAPSVSNGAFKFNGFFGKYAYTATVDGKTYSGQVDLPKKGPSATVTLSQPSATSTAVAGRR